MMLYSYRGAASVSGTDFFRVYLWSQQPTDLMVVPHDKGVFAAFGATYRRERPYSGFLSGDRAPYEHWQLQIRGYYGDAWEYVRYGIDMAVSQN